ncbi:PQQ-dependent sugar dehydrogenase [Salinisphaera sp. Q1T1-3]|nr:PQQ-dependent sugar dehydrogenase [Salinisphaera sp. Q1T1-3]
MSCLGLLTLALCASAAAAAETFIVEGDRGTRLRAEGVARFDKPWAMTMLPDRTMLVTEQAGRLWHVRPDGRRTEVSGVPEVAYGGQGGLGDVIADPDFQSNRRVYLSYATSNDNGQTRGAAVARATLAGPPEAPRLTEITRLWQQQPFVTGTGHYSHRLAIGPAGTPQAGYLFITSGERQKQSPAQAMDSNLGKIIRLHRDGRVPSDNPFAERGGLAAQFWSIGHRNLLGIAFDETGHLWAQEMGPRHGDELNRIEPGANYGWPEVSEGDHYDGRAIPDHATAPSYHAPAVAWVPAISPAGLTFYDGQRFDGWQGNALLGGLSSKALVRVAMGKDNVHEAERYSWDRRVREVEVADDGAIWVLEDNDGRLLRLTPASS